MTMEFVSSVIGDPKGPVVYSQWSKINPGAALPLGSFNSSKILCCPWISWYPYRIDFNFARIRGSTSKVVAWGPFKS